MNTINTQIVHIRQEMFEHSVYPTPTKLTLINLVNIFTSLNQVANNEKKVTLEQFKEHCQKHINEKDAEIYFINFKIMTEEDMQFLHKKQQLTADVRALAIYLFLQLFGISSRHNFSLDFRKQEFNTHFNEVFKSSMQHNFSPLNSPRSKTTRTTTQFTSEYQQAAYYIKFNIKTILRLLSNDLNNEDCMISSKDLNILQIIIKPEIPKQQKNMVSNKQFNLAQCTQLYTNSQQKVSSKQLSEWITNALSINENQENIVYIQGLNKSVMCKDDKQCGGQDLRIVNCEDSYLYIDSSVYTLSISNCSNMTIFVSAVQKICTIDKCENITVVVAANFIRIGNTIDSCIHYYGSYNPVLYGDNRSITLAPHNANHLELFERIKNAKISLNYKNTQLFSMPYVMNMNQCINYQIINIKDFFCINLPQQFKTVPHQIIGTFDCLLSQNFEKQIMEIKNTQQNNNVNTYNSVIIPLMAPNEFREQIVQRYKYYQEIQNSIMNSGLNDQQQKLLQDAIQGYFREWMVQTGQIKPISDLVKMIDQD